MSTRLAPSDTRRLTGPEVAAMLHWCAETFGPADDPRQPDQASRWRCDLRYNRFFFATQEDYAMFLLAFSGPQPA